jgi:phenylacetate-CoA ligase
LRLGGPFGELVFTSLTKEALPIIRYRTRDLTRLLPGTARTMRRMQKITGRSDDMMIIRGVNVFPTQIEELIMKHNALAPHYLCELTRDGQLDNLTIVVEARQGFAPTDEQVTAAGKQLLYDVKAYIGVSAQLRLAPEGAIERSLGKAKRVLDKR